MTAVHPRGFPLYSALLGTNPPIKELAPEGKRWERAVCADCEHTRKDHGLHWFSQIPWDSTGICTIGNCICMDFLEEVSDGSTTGE